MLSVLSNTPHCLMVSVVRRFFRSICFPELILKVLCIMVSLDLFEEESFFKAVLYFCELLKISIVEYACGALWPHKEWRMVTKVIKYEK